MKVLHLNTTVVDSSSSVSLQNALLDQGIDSHILTIKADLQNKNRVIELPKASLYLTGIKILESLRIRYNLKSAEYPFNTSAHGYDLVDMDLVSEADIIHLHWICGMVDMRGLAQLASLGKPVIWTCRDIWAYTGGCHIEYESCDRYTLGCMDCPFLRKGSKLAHQVITNKHRWLANAPITYIAPSRWMQRNIERSILGGQRCEYIPNTRDFDIYRAYSRDEMEQILKVDIAEEFDGYINVLFGATSARIPYKGFRYLERLMERLRSDDPELADRIMIHIVGNFDEASEALSGYKIKRWGFVGDRHVMAAIYSLNDIFITPSVADNLPSMVMEALGCETPVLAFDTGGTSDMLEHQVSGYLAGYKDEDDFYHGLKWIIDNNAGNVLGAAGRKKMLADFSYDTVVDKHIALYKELLGK